MTVDLTRDMIPSGVRVLSFVPGELLRIRVSLPMITRLTFFLFSLVFYLVPAQIPSYVLGAIFGSHQFISLGCNAAAMLVCITMNIRGAVLTIFLTKPKYRLSSPVSLVVRNETPRIEATTTSKAGRWISTLSVAEQPITTNTSEISAAEAESPFAAFIAAFPRPAATAAVDQSAEGPTSGEKDSLYSPAGEQALPTAPRPARPKERPLAILVHGTWGQQSTWAFPDKSHLVSALERKLSCDVEYRRFCWSGANRTSVAVGNYENGSVVLGQCGSNHGRQAGCRFNAGMAS
jgi:hypothetical protein